MSITSFIIIARFSKFIIKNDSNENNFDIKKHVSNRKRLTLIFKILKEKKIQEFDFIDIIEIDVSAYYYLIRNKENKLFSLIINEIYDALNQSFKVLSQMKRDNRISINKSCSYDFTIK